MEMGKHTPERESYEESVFIKMVINAINNFNNHIPRWARGEALKKVLRTESPNLIINNHNFHKTSVDAIDVGMGYNTEFSLGNIQ